MSKNNQRNHSEINLGNATYERGFNDGLNGRPKTIKKTHRHAHRYHIGYRAGDRERNTTRQAALAVDSVSSPIRTHAYLPGNLAHPWGADHVENLGKPQGFWQRFAAWLRGK